MRTGRSDSPSYRRDFLTSPPISFAARWTGLVGHLAVFEDLEPQTLEIVVGLLPAVRESRAKALLPRQRPPLIVDDNFEAVGPEGSIIVDDLRAFLLEIASNPPRLRQDGELFQKESDRFLDALGTLPSWLMQALKLSQERRLSQAFSWAQALKLVGTRILPKEKWLEVTPQGRRWMAGSPGRRSRNEARRDRGSAQASGLQRGPGERAPSGPGLGRLGARRFVHPP